MGEELPEEPTFGSSAAKVKRSDAKDSGQGFCLPNDEFKSVKVNLGASKISAYQRKEMLLLQHDSRYDAFTCFHIEVDWVVASAGSVDEWIKKSLFKKAKACGLDLVQIPASQPLRTSDAFHSTIPLRLEDPAHREAAVHYLRTECDFVLDSYTRTSRKQYMHRTGMAVVRVVSTGLVWVNNNLRSAASLQGDSIQLFRRFRAFCASLEESVQKKTNEEQASSTAQVKVDAMPVRGDYSYFS